MVRPHCGNPATHPPEPLLRHALLPANGLLRPLIKKRIMSITASEVHNSFWQQDLTSLMALLKTTPEGLASDEASIRLDRFGPNSPQEAQKRHLILQFLAKFRNPLVIVLLTASAVSGLTGDLTGFVIITTIVLISVIIDFIQEHKAGQAVERLRQSVVVRVHAMRDGTTKELPIAHLVPGDIVLLAAGDLVPGDSRVLEARDFFVNQALLTGEPYPVEKAPGTSSPPTDILSASNTVLMGTSVISGTARVLVCRTGPRTLFGDIAEDMSAKAPPSAFELGTRRFGLLIMRMTVLLVLFVLLINALLHRPWLESFLFAVALAVGLTPELLPMVVSVTLARGAQRMALKRVIVKRLSSIQNLGSMDVLCTDKTGTLTEAQIQLVRHIDSLGNDSERVLLLAYLNSYFETGLKSPLDEAILEHKEVEVAGWRKVDEVPFDFERRRVSVLADNGSQRILVVKGAPEDILRLCTMFEGASDADLHPLDQASLEEIKQRCDALGHDGFRVLGIAWRRESSDFSHAVVSDEAELVFAGFAAFLDPPKDSAREALAKLSAAGVSVKVVTGDNELVTRHVCGELGMPVTGILTGTAIHRMDDQALAVQVLRANIFCRVSPAQKNRVIMALKTHGHTVGYLGDGINDAPALHSADIGISVDSAVDIAKDAAGVILLERDLGVLHDGVIEGRRTFGNVMKYILMGTSSNFGNMFSMAGGSLFLPFLPMLPSQILLNNMLYDISEISIPLDNVDEEHLTHPQKWDIEFVRRFMLTVGPVSSVFDILTFFVMLKVFDAGEALFRTGWFVESLATQVLVIFIIRTHKNPFKSRPNPWLVSTSLAVVACAVALPFSPLGNYFGFVPLPPLFFAFLAGMVICYLFIVEIVKQHFFRHYLTR